jgi:hypothetical protein
MTTPLKTATARRQLLLGGLAATASALAGAAESGSPALPTTPTTDTIPLVLPRTEFVYEAIADLEPALTLGPSPFGDRFMVPIVGGTFEGIGGLRGKVMAGGADRQLLRRDGAKALDAVYELQTHDGAVISIRNRVLTRPLKDKPGRYAFSTLEIIAPDGPYGWLNDWVYVGTLDSLRPKRNAVVIRVYRVV